MIDDDLAMLVVARRNGVGLAAYPGTPPPTLADAYAIQGRANEAWGDGIAGWKVGRINPPLDVALGADRFLGAVFAGSVVAASSESPTPFPVIADGFGAFEAELVMTLAADADPARTDWDVASALALVRSVHIGVEIAGSPIATIPAAGPTGSIAAFGNNNGMILGAAIAVADAASIDAVTCTTSIDGAIVASRSAVALPGGPLAALAFALNCAASLGKPLTAGRHVLTGAITGVHPVRPGQVCTADFGRYGRIDCVTVTAAPDATAGSGRNRLR